MKKSEVKHIFDTQHPGDNKTLVFTHYINAEWGVPFSGDASLSPDRYDNVRHITDGLFYAWDDDPTEGFVYFGRYE